MRTCDGDPSKLYQPRDFLSSNLICTLNVIIVSFIIYICTLRIYTSYSPLPPLFTPENSMDILYKDGSRSVFVTIKLNSSLLKVFAGGSLVHVTSVVSLFGEQDGRYNYHSGSN